MGVVDRPGVVGDALYRPWVGSRNHAVLAHGRVVFFFQDTVEDADGDSAFRVIMNVSECAFGPINYIECKSTNVKNIQNEASIQRQVDLANERLPVRSDVSRQIHVGVFECQLRPW